MLKTGRATTEFLLALVGVAFGCLFALAGLLFARDVAMAGGCALAAVSSAAYAHSRALAKAGDAPTEHERSVATALRSPHRAA